MSTIKISFDDKDNNQPTTDPRRKWADDDANEVKSVVNAHADQIDLNNQTVTQTITSASSITPDTDYYDMTQVTAQAEALTINAPSGSPEGNRGHIIKIKDNGTSWGLTWDSVFRVIGLTLPTATTISKWHYIGVIWNALDSKWDVVSVLEEA